VDTIVIKCQRALEATGNHQLLIAGGVSANLRLRAQLEARLDARVFYPSLRLCTDNGAMIAFAGYLRLAAGEGDELAVRVRPRWPMTELTEVGGPAVVATAAPVNS
ncbi:MAG: hypothetical protein KDI31_16475, partial [Pseudomonadales bacterium]|nr:hypothetical protein [Pseudomonadales bacterium]